MRTRTEVVSEVLERLPVSLRELARVADVPVSTLSRIGSGELNASEDVARRVAIALSTMGEQLEAAAAMIRSTIPDG
jgi:plasmid maintenance system antidote protein VapI